MRTKQLPRTDLGLPPGHGTMAPHPDSPVDPPPRRRKKGTTPLDPSKSARTLKRQAKEIAQAEKIARLGAPQAKGCYLEEAARALKAAHALKVPLLTPQAKNAAQALKVPVLTPQAKKAAQAQNEEQQEDSAVEDLGPPVKQPVVVDLESPTKQPTAVSPNQVGCNRRIFSGWP